MDNILHEFQKDDIDKEEALLRLKEHVNLGDSGSNNIITNAVALLIKDYSFRDHAVRKVFGLFVEFGAIHDSENNKSKIGGVCGIITKTLVEDLLLEGSNSRDLYIRLNSLIGLNMTLKLLASRESSSELKMKLDMDHMCDLMQKIVSRDKSILAKKVAVANLGLIEQGKVHLLRLLTSENPVLRMKSLESISMLDLEDKDMNILFSRILDEDHRVRRAFYNHLSKHSVDFKNLILSKISWSHFIIVCQFGLNDRNTSVRKSCLEFILEFVSNNYASGRCFCGISFVSLLDEIIYSVYSDRNREDVEEREMTSGNHEEYSDTTASNIEALTEILLPNLLNHLNYDLDLFVRQVTASDTTFRERAAESTDSDIISGLKTSQILVLRVLVQNYRERILDCGEYEYINVESVIISISKNSNNSFIIRQMLLILSCIDKSDPEVAKVAETLSINCLKYTPIDDSLELLESELIPSESMIRSSNGGEWVAYFLNRSVIRASMDSLFDCLEGDALASRVKGVIGEILVSGGDERKEGFSRRGIEDFAEIGKHDFFDAKERVEMRWMRVLFIVESFLSLVRKISIDDITYITEGVLKPCTNFFFKNVQDLEIPQILLARCTALVTIAKEKNSTSLDPGVGVDSTSTEDNLRFFIRGLNNALCDLSKETNSFNVLYISVLCEVYVSSVVDILIIRQVKYGGNIDFGGEIIDGIKSIWKLASSSFVSTYRLSSISIRGVSRILLCLKTKDYFEVSVEILTCLLYLVYFSDTLDEFQVLLEPQGKLCSNKHDGDSDFEENTLNEVFSVIKLIKREGSLSISSGDKQILLYLFSTYITLGSEQFRCFAISIYRLLDVLCENVSISCWNSTFSGCLNKLLLFGIIQMKQAISDFGSVENRRCDKLYSNIYGILFLYYIFNKYPRHSKKINLRSIMSKLFLDLDLETKIENEGTDTDHLLYKLLVFILERQVGCTNLGVLKGNEEKDTEATLCDEKGFRDSINLVANSLVVCCDGDDKYLKDLIASLLEEETNVAGKTENDYGRRAATRRSERLERRRKVENVCFGLNDENINLENNC